MQSFSLPLSLSHIHTHVRMVGYLSRAAGNGDPVLAGDVTGAVVGGTGT